MAEDPDQHDVIADPRHDYATRLADVAVVNAERSIGKAHRIARQHSEVRIGGQNADADIGRKLVIELAPRGFVSLRCRDVAIICQNCDRAVGGFAKIVRSFQAQRAVTREATFWRAYVVAHDPHGSAECIDRRV